MKPSTRLSTVDFPHPLGIEGARTIAQPAVNGAGENVEDELDVDAPGKIPAFARALQH